VGHAAFSPIRVDAPTDMPGDSVAMHAQLRLLRQIADSTPRGLVVTASSADARSLQVVYANRAFATLFADPKFEGTIAPPHFHDHVAFDHPLWKSLRESHQSRDQFSTDIVLPTRDGKQTILRLRSEPMQSDSSDIPHRLAIFDDITQQIALEEVVRRNERLTCIGLLAAEIAHEINNPAGSALLAAETALAIMNSPNAGPQVEACLRNIVTSIDRCGRIVRTLLRYSREEPSEKQACNINDVVKQAVELAKPYAERHHAKLEMELDEELPLIPMNPLEIELVLINLLRNAIEAGKGGVTVRIHTQRRNYGVRTKVCDNGCGMDQEQLAHVFDPLYTTRRASGGSGLGMSIVQGIVQTHNGRMDVRSQLGEGTCITMDLPVAAVAQVVERI
jgi:signal transduction histidine kinase